MKFEEGIVKNVYPERGTVRVARQTNDGVISAELKIAFPGTLNNQFYSMPSIEEHVLCLWPDKTKTDGYVIGCIYSDVTEPPVKDENKHYVKFKDGSYIEHDTKLQEMRIHCKGKIIMEAQEVVTNVIGSG
ncbi:hypothetical protein [Solibacillus sp.]|uniref:hypothetical protein n=1 Tax=Solibacillus sp. TaxID=1909654 RepID=UPI0033152F4F